MMDKEFNKIVADNLSYNKKSLFSKYLRDRRTERYYSQKHLANLVGSTETVISCLEANIMDPKKLKRDIVIRLVEVFSDDLIYTLWETGK